MSWVQLFAFVAFFVGAMTFTRNFRHVWMSHLNEDGYGLRHPGMANYGLALLTVALGIHFHGHVPVVVANLDNIKLSELSVLRLLVLSLGGLIIYRGIGSIGAVVGHIGGTVLGAWAKKILLNGRSPFSTSTTAE